MHCMSDSTTVLQGDKGKKVVSVVVARKSALMPFFELQCTVQFRQLLTKVKCSLECKWNLGIDSRERLFGNRMAVFTILVSHQYCQAGTSQLPLR